MQRITWSKVRKEAPPSVEEGMRALATWYGVGVTLVLEWFNEGWAGARNTNTWAEWEAWLESLKASDEGQRFVE